MFQLPREFGSFNGLAGLCISVYCVHLGELSGLSASLGWAVWVFQLPREFGSFNGLAGLCISVYCVHLGVL